MMISINFSVIKNIFYFIFSYIFIVELYKLYCIELYCENIKNLYNNIILFFNNLITGW